MQSTRQHTRASPEPDGLPPLATLAVATFALLGFCASAAAGGAQADAQARYRQERAACLAGQTSQDRETCLKEAGAALQEARRGSLDNAQTSFEQARTTRCERLPPDDHEDCLRRMRGEGTVSGSVEGGGIYRELRTTVPAR